MKASMASLLALATVWAATRLGMAQDVRITRDGGGSMTLAKIEGIELEYDVRGTGEPVVLVHAASSPTGSSRSSTSPPSPAGTRW
jgi:hypothetical protein